MSESTEDSAQLAREASETVSANQTYAVGGQIAALLDVHLANTISHQQAMQQTQLAQLQTFTTLNSTIQAKAAEMILNTSPSEAGGDVAALTQLLKGASITPPANQTDTSTSL